MHDQNKGTGAFWPAVIGAAVGAAAVILSDKKTREMIKRRVSGMIEDAEEIKETGKERINEEIKKTKGKLKKMVDK